jgi:flagellar protein FliO/FliZ
MEFGTDLVRGLLALIFVLALIGVLTALARRFGLGYSNRFRGNRGNRLSISETIPLDARRKLVLIRRDEVEHLVLLGAGTSPDLLIENGIPAPDNFQQALAASAPRNQGQQAVDKSAPKGRQS